MSDQIGRLLEGAKAGRQNELAQLLTLVEREGPRCLKHKALLEPKHLAFRLGITGPPGAGKSTLVGHLIRELRKDDLKVAVLAVDPSSPFSHGAILGDRIRYGDQTMDSGVFIRSVGTRGSLGGLSSASYLMLRVFDAAEYDVVLVETVGVGQTELEIMNVADKVIVMLVPESGDSIQAMKAGLLEIADLFVVNKSDRPGAASLAKELEFISETAAASRHEPRVLSTVATTGDGIGDVVNWVKRLATQGTSQEERHSPRRLQEEAKSLLRSSWESKNQKKWAQIRSPKDLFKALVPSPAPRSKVKRKNTKTKK